MVWEVIMDKMMMLCSSLYPCLTTSLNHQGFYRGGRFVFSFKVGPNYPHEPPKVKCETMVSVLVLRITGWLSIFRFHQFSSMNSRAVSNFLGWDIIIFGRHCLCLFSCWKTDATGILIAGLLIVNLYCIPVSYFVQDIWIFNLCFLSSICFLFLWLKFTGASSYYHPQSLLFIFHYYSICELVFFVHDCGKSSNYT